MLMWLRPIKIIVWNQEMKVLTLNLYIYQTQSFTWPRIGTQKVETAQRLEEEASEMLGL